MKRPDEEVAERIIEQFKKENLLNEAKLERLKGRLAEGTQGSLDWKVDFETNRQKEAKE